jgi:integrase
MPSHYSRAQPDARVHDLMAGIKDFPRVRFRDLRQTHAMQLLLAGVHPKIAQGRLGHSTIATTNGYLLSRQRHNAGGSRGQARRGVPGCGKDGVPIGFMGISRASAGFEMADNI